MEDMLRASLLALRKNPRRNHLRFYCMVTAQNNTLRFKSIRVYFQPG